jgi:sulfur relay (sulfurtransferase) complex TusBCD TusD component (DsrE family)
LICALSAESRGFAENDLLPGVGFMSQYELSDIVSRSDRFLCFGG